MSFASLKLHEDLLKAVEALGFETPTQIQNDAIPPARRGRDILAGAETGSGKTAAFVLPILHRMLEDEPKEGIRVLILAPTRELTQQVHEHFEELAQFTEFTGAAIYGGVPSGPQERCFTDPVDVLVATPGRLLDHLQYDYAHLDNVEYLVLDEADRMLDMGFLPDVKRVLERLPEDRQNLLFSATIPKPIADLAQEMLDDPAGINLEQRPEPPKAIRQMAFPVPEGLKRELLLELLDREEVRNVLIFTRSKHRANRLAQFLQKSGVECDRLHGNRTQAQRTAAMKGFKEGKIRVLVATNLAARGIDVDDLSHVLNFDVPNVPDDYIHRVGRTGRLSTAGDALTLYSPEEYEDLRAIERALGHEFPKVILENFDYQAEPGDRLEIPVKERLANLRKRRAEERSRRDGGNRRGRRHSRPGEQERFARGPAKGPAAKGPAKGRRSRRRREGNGTWQRRDGQGGEVNGNVAPREMGHRPVNGDSWSKKQQRRGRKQSGSQRGVETVALHFEEGQQPVLKPEYELPERDPRRPKRASHTPAALSKSPRRFQAVTSDTPPETPES